MALSGLVTAKVTWYFINVVRHGRRQAEFAKRFKIKDYGFLGSVNELSPMFSNGDAFHEHMLETIEKLGTDC